MGQVAHQNEPPDHPVRPHQRVRSAGGARLLFRVHPLPGGLPRLLFIPFAYLDSGRLDAHQHTSGSYFLKFIYLLFIFLNLFIYFLKFFYLLFS